MAPKTLKFKLTPRTNLAPHHLKRMFELMRESYDHIAEEQFILDLENKQLVGLLLDPHDNIEGFTTFGINPSGTQTKDFNILFSGDTIISPKSWGSSEMITGGIKAAGRIMANDTQRKWYWF